MITREDMNQFNAAVDQGIISLDIEKAVLTVKNGITKEAFSMEFDGRELAKWHTVTPIIHWAEVIQRVKDLEWL